MSTIGYLNRMEIERMEIERLDPKTVHEWIDYHDRAASWWHQRDLGFGDGSGSKRHHMNRAEFLRGVECEFCENAATRIEKFDRQVYVCDLCSAESDTPETV